MPTKWPEEVDCNPLWYMQVIPSVFYDAAAFLSSGYHFIYNQSWSEERNKQYYDLFSHLLEPPIVFPLYFTVVKTQRAS